MFELGAALEIEGAMLSFEDAALPIAVVAEVPDSLGLFTFPSPATTMILSFGREECGPIVDEDCKGAED